MRASSPRFASSATATIGSQLAVACLNFLGVLVVSRSLGPSGRGQIAFLMTVSVVTSTLALLGLDEANVNIAALEPRTSSSVATNSLLFSVLLGGAFAAGVAALGVSFPALRGDSPSWLWLVALTTVPVMMLKVYLKSLLRADYRFAVANAAWVLPALLALAANALLAAVGRLTVVAAFSTWAAAHTCATALLVCYVVLRGHGFGRPSIPLGRRALSFGVRSHVGKVTSVGNYRLDQWFVGAIAGPHELGLYSIAVAWSEVLFYLPTAIVLAQRPYLVRATQSEAGRLAAKVFRSSLLVSIPMVAGIVVLAPVLCTTVFGREFRGSVDDLRVLAVGSFGILAMKLLGNALSAQGRPGLSSVGPSVALLVTISLDLALIAPFGGFGAGSASTLAYTAAGVMTVVLFLRFFDRPISGLVPRVGEIPGLFNEARSFLTVGRRVTPTD